MKRTDIKELFPDATDEQISKIMDLNGADINKAKGEADDLKSQLATAQTEIENLKKGGDHAEELATAQSRIGQLETELAGMRKADEIRTMREKVSAEKKVPAHLLTGETEEACAKQADDILGFAQIGSGYPKVRDAGETGGKSGTSAREQFAEYANKVLGN